MNLKTKKEKLENYIKLNDIVNLNWSISLIEINRLMNKTNKASLHVDLNSRLINVLSTLGIEIANLHAVNKHWFSKKSKKRPLKTLWIYPTSDEKYTTAFFTAVEEEILASIQPQDEMVCIGKKAIAFALKNNIKTLVSYENELDINQIAIQLSTVLGKHIKDFGYDNVYFMVKNQGQKDLKTVIFPVDKNNIQLPDNDLIKTEHLKNEKLFTKALFYPSVKVFSKNMLVNYFYTSINLLLLESLFIVYKNKLINENKTLKELEEKIKYNKREILKIKRELEIEEMNLIESDKLIK
ncbi:hypothetical protein JM47_02845 [Ureaplasma diversum]|uniref:ATP synthase (F1-ATPase), gamma subunit n=2 Tax=Ureaplasma diversum TaxID=42094 RepID=A0A084EZW8_9BACT|nr:hypothetical protein [Ureaplasma diversum]AJQ45491.1 hypothetical protein JM47_02845 [Ureaplasma diversum]KEZ23510.1 ATP synthase (F1-ATPase), gamma subunit [Ureaplasma diversum NCTC 246]